MNIAQAAKASSREAGLSFSESADGLVTISIENELASASLALQGGHLIHWQPIHAPDPVFWLSKRARFGHGRSIRGGVPICWPWFGAHPTDDRLCPHGFARIMPWHLMDSALLDNGATRLELHLLDTPVAHQQLPHPYELTLTVEVGSTLKMALATTNKGDASLVIGEALHTYFQIGDIDNIHIEGLDGTEYADKTSAFSRHNQQGDIRFSQEYDRVFVNTAAECTIVDPDLKRRIRIAKTGSQSTVIWTPGQIKAEELQDIGPGDDWRHMICVESANALENVVSVGPGETHVLTVEYSTEEL
ncbi:MAG TPA: D-hexose-6-phosphate mutarotase [Methylophilaceae bacterium]|nr:D-hexose-6-phosphate mutarotase [Methylophilaceae bacterium]